MMCPTLVTSMPSPTLLCVLLRSITLPEPAEPWSVTVMPLPSLKLAVLSTMTLSRDTSPSEMPSPAFSLALLASIRLPLDRSSSRPTEAKRRSLPRIVFSPAWKSWTPAPPRIEATLPTSSLATESETTMPFWLSVTVLCSTTLSLDSRVRAMASPPLSAADVRVRRFDRAPTRRTPSPAEPATRLSSKTLLLELRTWMPVERAAAHGVVAYRGVLGARCQGDAVGVAADGVRAEDVAVAGGIGVGQLDPGERVELHGHRLDDAEARAGVEGDAVVESLDESVADRHGVEAVVAHAGAGVEAGEDVTVEVDGDAVGADDDAVGRAVDEVVGHAGALGEHLATRNVRGHGRRTDGPGVRGRRRVGVARGVAGAHVEAVIADRHLGELGWRRARREVGLQRRVEAALERRRRPHWRRT